MNSIKVCAKNSKLSKKQQIIKKILTKKIYCDIIQRFLGTKGKTK